MSDISKYGHVEPTAESFRALLARGLTGPVVMLNLLRFRQVADYSASPHMAPDTPVSGRDAYATYADQVAPMLQAAGGQVVYIGNSGAHLIGPTEEAWDRVLLVRYGSLQAFLSMVADPAYLTVAAHRTAALVDSRLLPMTDGEAP
ncbi:MAG: hypothetical protein ACI9MR_001576 [Myxococcota bacterium]|jgi:uncharacterized protein (DUF1330 family)